MYKSKAVGKLDRRQEGIANWTRCKLSGEELREPVVCDLMGALYNKEAVVQGLMGQLQGGAKMPPHLTLKTVLQLRLARNPHAATGGGGAAAGGGTPISPFWCPVTEQEVDGKHRFVAVRSTGHVVAERALREVPALVEEHVGCPVGDADVLVLNGTEEERAAYAEVSVGGCAV